MTKFLILPVLSSVLLAAHFSRVEMNWLVPFALLFPCILFIKQRWIIRIYQVYLVIGALIWIERLFYLRKMRIAAGDSWTVMVIILGTVALITLFSAGLLQKKRLLNAYSGKNTKQ